MCKAPRRERNTKRKAYSKCTLSLVYLSNYPLSVCLFVSVCLCRSLSVYNTYLPTYTPVWVSIVTHAPHSLLTQSVQTHLGMSALDKLLLMMMMMMCRASLFPFCSAALYSFAAIGHSCPDGIKVAGRSSSILSDMLSWSVSTVGSVQSIDGLMSRPVEEPTADRVFFYIRYILTCIPTSMYHSYTAHSIFPVPVWRFLSFWVRKAM